MTHLPHDVLSTIIGFIQPRPDPTLCMDTVADLRHMCRTRGLTVGGKKLDLINRLLHHGCYARRAFWDTGEYANPSPALTFRKELHTAQLWDAHVEQTLADCSFWREEGPLKQYQNTLVREDGAARMYSRYLRQLKARVRKHRIALPCLALRYTPVTLAIRLEIRLDAILPYPDGWPILGNPRHFQVDQ